MNINLISDKLTATIATKGAELTSLKKEGKEYIWEGNPEFWGKHSPILFPIVGTLKDNSYIYNDKHYELSRHGFARDNDFHSSEISKNSAVFSFSSSIETLKQYPFDFELKITYTLDDDSLIVKYEVTNNGLSKMPFSIGGHPAFALPNNFEDYSLHFENDQSITSYSLKGDLLSDETTTFDLIEKQLPLTYSLFANDALIFKKLNSEKIQIRENQKPIVEIRLNDFPNLGIWTKNNAPFLCIEPWFGYSDLLTSNGDLFKKEGIIILNPKERFETSFEVKIY